MWGEMSTKIKRIILVADNFAIRIFLFKSVTGAIDSNRVSYSSLIRIYEINFQNFKHWKTFTDSAP